ncbi:hypothetical protein WH47_05665 [Habropoda laboriosa]|uniref:F-box domain-containing protein n=1 Tax=Habropoda laboriosa TaxID=597456 RepID=A0A0L7QQI9_9HYME|nr:PREDICTED: uncharacterized protein LOC108576483 [Habropoda laboriosa]KOC60887.1 hypothetical protein WH47_05665 [Habropoda laboriosa]
MMFPPEIWEQILIYVDSVVLINLKIVCKCWNEIINKILKQSDVWYKLCQNQIPEHFWTTLCETLCPNQFYVNFHEKNDAKFWMAVYKLWIKCKNLIKCDTQITCIEPLLKNPSSEYITCIDTCGSIIAMGTSEGFVYFYDISNLSRSTKCVVDHMEYIRKVQLLRDGTDIVCISCSINDHITFWHVNSLNLIDRTHGKIICTSYSFCYIATNNMIRIEGSIARTMYDFGRNTILAVGASNNKVLIYMEGGYYVHITLDEDKRNYTCTCAQPLNMRIRSYYIFKSDIVVCITEYGYLGFLESGKEWKVHNVFPILHGTPTAVLVYAHVLIVGLDSGNVHIYYINDFGKINFNITNSKKLTLDTTAVISLNIMVHVEEFLYLIVAYSKKFYIVKFI